MKIRELYESKELSRWFTVGAKQMLKDYNTDAKAGFPLTDIEVYGRWHNRAFPDGAPVLKYFSRGGGSTWNIGSGNVTIPKQNVVVMISEGFGYTYVDGYGFVEFDYEDYEISNKPLEYCEICGNELSDGECGECY